MNIIKIRIREAERRVTKISQQGPCAHENACVRCPLLRVDPAQMPRLEEIRANLRDRLQEARQQRWLGEVAAIETTLAAAAQKLEAMRELTARSTTVSLGMPGTRR